MNYEELLSELFSLSEPTYRDFHRSLLKNDAVNVMGVRIPSLRALARRFKGSEDELMSFPDEWYEVTFIKLAAVAAMPYDEFCQRVERCVDLIDNWATCDGFTARCIARRRDDFIPYIKKFLSSPKEFYQRYALTTLLSFYVDKSYLPLIFSCCRSADTSMYYVHMAVAWLMAEVLAKHFDEGVQFLKQEFLTPSTHNKAISKARESYRLTPEQKIYLKNLKR